jgi:DNA polymerase-3 subunit delta
MAEINHKELEGLLATIKKGDVSPVYLLYGDEFLYKTAFKAIIDCLIPESDRLLNYEVIDGRTENIHDTVERLNTFPMIPTRKVVAVQESRIFISKKDAEAIFAKSRAAIDEKEYRKAALCFFDALAVTGWSLDDIKDGAWRNISDADWEKHVGFKRDVEGLSWIDDVIKYAVDHRIPLPTYQDDLSILEELLKEGLPADNTLVVTTSFADKRRTLYKTIKKIGTVVDCSAPEGTRSADRKAQLNLFKMKMESILKKEGKSVDHAGLSELLDRTGYDLRRFVSELEKVIQYVGDRKKITASDIKEVTERSREDPLYEFGNVIGERDTEHGLLILHNLLENNVHPLQVLAAIVNCIRRLLLAKDFIRSDHGRGWKAGLSYAAFQSTILPEIKKGATEGFMSTAHPFVLYKTLLQADNFELEELLQVMPHLLDTDSRLKLSPQSPRIVMEQLIVKICGGDLI